MRNHLFRGVHALRSRKILFNVWLRFSLRWRSRFDVYYIVEWFSFLIVMELEEANLIKFKRSRNVRFWNEELSSPVEPEAPV